MIGWLVNRRMKAFQSKFNYDMTYAREIYDASPRAFWRLSRVFGLSQHRENVPRNAWYAAKIMATLFEDCSPCTQLLVSMAERDGLQPSTLRAIVTACESEMPQDVALAFCFARSVLTRDIAESDTLRTKVIERWGRRGLVSLALTIASSRVYPAVKYALGHGHKCSQVKIAGVATPAAR